MAAEMIEPDLSTRLLSIVGAEDVSPSSRLVWQVVLYRQEHGLPPLDLYGMAEAVGFSWRSAHRAMRQLFEAGWLGFDTERQLYTFPA